MAIVVIVIMSRCIIKDCKHDPFLSVKALYLHIQMSHRWHVNKKIICQEEKCCRDFEGWRAFRRHLISFHKVPAISHSTNRSETNLDIDCGSMPHQNIKIDGVADYQNAINIDNSENILIRVQDFALYFITKLYAIPSFPRSIVQNIVDET